MAKTKGMMTEAALMNSIIEELLYRKMFVWRSNNVPVFDAKNQTFRRMPKFSMPGLPDISGILPGGRALFIEVKRVGTPITQAQDNFIQRAKLNGAVAFVARSMDDVYWMLEGQGFILKR